MIDRVTVLEAAKRLHITEGAIRQRIHRGTLRSDRDQDGRVYVYVTPEDTDNDSVNTPKYDSDEPALVEELRSRIRFLEHELEDRKDESRRKDTIIAQMNQTLHTTINRIPELEGPSDVTESSVSYSDEESRGDVSAETEKGFWRRLFG